jgi:hypothetical protein
MITITPTNPSVKFGGKQKFTASHPGTYSVRSENDSTKGSTVDSDGNYVAGQPAAAAQQAGSDIVTVTASDAANGSASARVSLTK